MPGYLHITNGDSAADIIKNCGVGGDVLPWRDPMHHGPFLADLPLDKLSRIRIDYLESKDPISLDSSLSGTQTHGFSERDATLAKAAQYDEVILWFEHDLLDQLQILQLLDWFAQTSNKVKALSLICIDRFDGVADFRGIGQLNSTQMASLLSTKQTVTQAHLDLAKTLWAAFCSTEPNTLISLLGDSLILHNKLLPFMPAALHRHCQEFPWTSDGLGRTERQLLSLVSNGVTHAPRIFMDNMQYETCLYIGDWRTYSQIATLCESDQALLACAKGTRFLYPPCSSVSAADFAAQELCITDFGQAVLEGKSTAIDTLKRDSWLGGVHLNSEGGLWLWNDEAREFIAG